MFKNNLKIISNIFKRFNCIKNNENEIKLIKQISEEDLNKFSELTDDRNILHSAELPAEQRFVHGALLNSLLAGIIGTRFPGSILLQQKFEFPHRCQINKDVEFLLKLVENRKLMKIDYECRQSDKIVFQGYAKLLRTKKDNR